ncbi:MAG: low molecular weight protein arginine phosphatase [Clostridia bacterium]|nr:low molecular weight protein arginine phosphatase [Clostridia bacterium]MDD4386321.1 low molecular weight protein arginine phosphatase [Clostridia bacterium]
MKSIMFICTGNICRSPMAHAYMQKKLYDLKKENEYMISSCGTNAIQGQCATDNAIEVMKKYDIDLTRHRATSLEYSNILDYDLILVLTDNHKRQILQVYPSLNDNIFTLKEYVNNKEKYKDIDDPWGLDINVYKATAKNIVENINKLLEMLLRK